MSGLSVLTHLAPVPHICVSELGQHWFRQWLVTWSAPSHYLNQCWNIVNWTFRNKLQWNSNLKIQKFHSWKCISKCRLGNGVHFVQGGELKAILYSPVWYDCLPDSFPELIYWSLNKYGVCIELSTWTFMISEMTLPHFTKKVKLVKFSWNAIEFQWRFTWTGVKFFNKIGCGVNAYVHKLLIDISRIDFLSA